MGTISKTIATCFVVLLFGSQASAWRYGKMSPLNSQRNVLNMNMVGNYDYAFINMVYTGDYGVSPLGSAYASTPSTWMQLLDSDGWPNNAAASGNSFAVSVRMPSSTNFGGPYIVTWTGSGTVQFSTAGTCTETNNTGTTYTRVSNCKWTNVAGQSAYIVMNISGVTQQTITNLVVSATGGADGFVKNIKMYRQSDEADLLAGNIFRTTWKQYIVDHNPSALRFMNWYGGNNNQGSRWEYRTLPTNAGYGGSSNWVASPPYGTASGTNIYSLAAVTTGANQTPASMLHGEVVTARFGNACVRGTTTGFTVTAVQNQNIPQVTTSAANPYQVGDTIVIRQTAGTVSGMMTKLNYFPVTVASVIDSTHFTINVDTTTWGSFTSSGNTIITDQYITLNVGSRGDYPIVFLDGRTSACRFGTAISTGGYKSMVFNKNVAAKSDGAGNYVYGIWAAQETTQVGYDPGAPVEIITALTNEINALAQSQGITNPINLWINVPVFGLLSIDPDYSLASNYAVQTVNAILNGSNGYAGLTSRSNVIVEYSNETWNLAGCGAFCQSTFSVMQSWFRWPTSGFGNTTDIVALRSTAMARDIRANVSGHGRVFIVMAGQGAAGFATNSGNRGRVYGNNTVGQAGNWYTTDSLVVSGGWGAPITWHDAFASGSYFDPPSSYYSTSTGTGVFTDDSAMYNGTDNTSNGGGNYTGAANQSQAITNFVNQTICGSSLTCAGQSGAGQSINNYIALQRTYAAGLPAGKPSIGYEGGTDWAVKVGQAINGHTMTANDQLFGTAVINSTQWAAAQINYFEAVSGIFNASMPPLYIFIGGTSSSISDQRWSYCSPDAYASGIEGQALANNPFWVGAGTRNRGLIN